MMCQGDQQLAKDISKVCAELAAIKANTSNLPQMSKDLEELKSQRIHVAGFAAGVAAAVGIIFQLGILAWNTMVAKGGH
jgi:hypothetical protein